MPLCVRMLYLVMFADSSATLASRIRLSAALLLTTCDCARPMANWQPVLEGADRCPARCRAWSTAVAMAATAVAALAARVALSRPLMPRPSCRVRARNRAADGAVGAVVADEHREAGWRCRGRRRSLHGRFPSSTSLELVVQLGAVDVDDRRGRLGREGREPVEQVGDVVERAVLDLQGRQTVVRVADALVEHRHLAAVAVGDGEAGRVVARLVDAQAARQAVKRLVQAGVGVARFAWALAAEMLLTTENEAMTNSSVN